MQKSLPVKLPWVKGNMTKVLTGGESIEQPSLVFFFFFYKKLYVKDVKINEVLKNKEEKYVGQSHPASKSLNLIKKNSIWTSTTLCFQK